MTRAVFLVGMLGLLAGCRDQEAACRRAGEDEAEWARDEWVQTCVRERWTDRQIRCYHRWRPGTFLGMFCDQQ